MPSSAKKKPGPQTDSAEPAASKSRKGLVKDEFDTDCWEPSLKDRLRRATGRTKP